MATLHKGNNDAIIIIIMIIIIIIMSPNKQKITELARLKSK